MLNEITDDLTARLRAELPEAAFRELSPAHLEDPRGRVTGRAGLVLAPGDVAQVSSILRACNEARVPVVPRGGGTGLVLGQVATAGPAPVLLSLERMAAIREVRPEENVMIAEAGAILADVQEAARAAGRLFPLSLAAEGSCMIGGNLATNAGGVNVLRYGNARDLCLGLEAVLPDGSVWHGLKRLRKDNTGYDLKNLLIGAEGTLGVITAASLRLWPRPAQTGTALFAVPSPAAALELLNRARARFAETVSAFELIGGTGLAFLAEVMPELRQPFDAPPDWSVLITLGLPEHGDTGAGFEALFAEALEAGLASDGTIAQSLAQEADLWRLRESLPEGNRRIGAIASHDIALPLSAIPDFLEACDAKLRAGRDIRINTFGHLGDGNLHYNLFPAKGRKREEYAAEAEELTRVVHDMVAAHDGTFSAEHGIGRLKVADLERYGDPARLAAMRAIKRALDPNGIMNPGAVLG